MVHLFWMVFLGLCAGMVSGFWTRIIRKEMIFEYINDFLDNRDRKKIINSGFFYESGMTKFLNCVFCLTPWLVFLFSGAYAIIYTPEWYFFVLGLICALGAGNLMAEIIYALRK